ncbi:hypothetical protein OAP97_00345 [Flavobacteriales bacterium]|jgi:hypothetical protein|nr:hypothetical protein [Flavobacteriales bacterium]MDG1284281.1 hypothetical protein [Flavobacteriales bacterium]|tara:strand:+ start:321 stop:758 length:438 start_codon:yes stop_codon:yes gene_type:complete
MNLKFTFIALILSLSIFAQPQKGSLLLEGQLNGAWTSIAPTNSGVFGIYLSENFALTIGSEVGIIDDETFNAFVGSRVHFTESTLLYTDIIYNDFSEEISIGLGIGNRFYANDWLAFEPRAGFVYISDILRFQTMIGISVFFEQP